ncbi:hypothetical protein MNBD_ALPHA06-2215 [hydrothermal vent metagenome]|uniref:Type II secretion system protein GspF domain-containing protein n=1 Tax=hydrothermal vent metagenome TaxID=652676 RepID=A0A3B0RF07_9ZZZZ
MKQWLIRVARPDGTLEEVSITAATELAAASQVRKRGLTPLSLREGSKNPRKKIKGAVQAATRLARELSALIGAGLTVERALQSLAKFADNSLAGKVANDLLGSVRAGNSLSQAFTQMPDIFPPPFPQIAEAGEASGSLAEALADLADWREKQQKFEAEMRGNLIYPVILLVFSAVAVIGLLLFVVPRFEQVFSDMSAQPPAMAAFVFSLSNGLGVWLPGIAAFVAVVMLAVGYWLRKPQSKIYLYRNAHQLPFLGKVARTFLAARFCRVLAVLLQNGLSAAPAFRLAGEGLSDVYAKEKLQNALEEVRRGKSLPDQIAATEIFPPLATEILRVGEETGDLAAAAKRLADLYEDRLERGTKLAVKLAEPLLIGFVGLVIGAIVISIILAMVSINEIGF